MAQHFLLSTKARTLSLVEVLRMSDDEAFETFKAVRWAENNGEAFCPHCGCVSLYFLKNRRMWRCKGCGEQFSVTSGTIFASHKLPLRSYLAAAAIFTNGAKGYSALQLSRDLKVQYKTAFVLFHKIREAMASKLSDEKLSGNVEVDGGYFGGYVKPANHLEKRRDLRLVSNQTGKRECVVVMRERNGRALPFVVKSEAASVPAIKEHVAPEATVYADDNSAWDVLHASYPTKRINHSLAYSDGDISTNWAESYFSRLRRMEMGQHHHIAGPYLASYADECAWREDHRRESNGQQYLRLVSAAAKHPVSRNWKGYWQRRVKVAAE